MLAIISEAQFVKGRSLYALLSSANGKLIEFNSIVVLSRNSSSLGAFMYPDMAHGKRLLLSPVVDSSIRA